MIIVLMDVVCVQGLLKINVILAIEDIIITLRNGLVIEIAKILIFLYKKSILM